MGYNFTAVEKKWQKHWLERKSFRALDPAEAGGMPKAYVLDMFPYPSGAGLHVGHPEGYTATDIYSRYLRMKGVNVLHPMGWDAFGLPAEQYAIKNNVHPAATTAKNIGTFRKQIQALGLSYDWDREVDTTDPTYYRWTQWIFLQLFNSYFDPVHHKAMPIGHLVAELENENYVVGPDGSVVTNRVAEGLKEVTGEVRLERTWQELSDGERRAVLDGARLAYTDEIPVNWCPGLGTVLSNEEVIDGKSEVGGYPVEKRPLRQWMLRITSYADRLVKDLDLLQWPESLKEMQRNWIGRSTGAEVDFEVDLGAGTEAPRHEGTEGEDGDGGDGGDVITVFTTRPDTLYGATFMVLAPEHPLVERLTTPAQRAAVEAYRAAAAAKSERDRQIDAKTKTGVFTGGYAVNPINDEKIPVYIADYVLMGYGTGAIMAVPAHDERDFAFAVHFNLPIKAVVTPDEGWLRSHAAAFIRARAAADTRGTPEARAAATAKAVETVAKAPVHLLQEDYAARPMMYLEAFGGEGVAINSELINGKRTDEAKAHVIAALEREGTGRGTVKYKLRDWLFSRQRYWGEPFPVVLDGNGNAYAISEGELPLRLPQVADFKPTGTPEPPLSKAKDWLAYTPAASSQLATLDSPLTRETNTMPQWAGSCWYYLRYIDPKNADRFVDPEKEKYWMSGGGVDLYVGGVEHAVLHLLYARFWHKVLFDLGHVSSPEPFARLVNQGLILGEMEFHFFEDARGNAVSASEMTDIDEENSQEFGVRLFGTRKSTGEKLFGKRLEEVLVEKVKDGFVLRANAAVKVDARSFKMSKSRGNVVNPDEIIENHGADALRLYEMYMGPLEATKPWNTRDIVGMERFIRAVYRHLVGDEEENRVAKIVDAPIPEALDRQLHRAIKKIGEDIEALRFNTAIAELIKLNNELPGLAEIPRAFAEAFTLLVAPFAPHLAEEVWQSLGHSESLARHPWPKYDPAKLVDTTLELPVQVNGKLRGKVTVAADAQEADIFIAAKQVESVRPWVEGKELKKSLYVPRKLVNFVVG
jgi:leucyl-tRNA synthetase